MSEAKEVGRGWIIYCLFRDSGLKDKKKPLKVSLSTVTFALDYSGSMQE